MNSALLNNILRFIGLLFLQVYVMDQVDFLGYICPLVYILFILLYPVDNNRWTFLIVAFFLGLIIDTFQDTGGAHAAASVTLAFIRPLFLRMVYGQGYLTKNLKINKSPLDRFALLLAISVLVHHLLLFILIYFNMTQVLQVLQMTLFIGISSVFMGIIIFILFGSRNKS